MFCAVESFGEIQQYVGGFGKGNYVRSGIWYKPNSMGQLTGDRPAIAFEGIAMMHNPAMRKRWNGRGRYAHWICNGTRGEPARHPNQKPLALLCDLVREFTDLGETIFDPFCGSGRIGEAALLCGRGYVGLDSDPIWVERAEVRCAAAALRWGELAAAAHRVCVMKGTCPGAGAGADRA
jgi:DNA modification methylase